MRMKRKLGERIQSELNNHPAWHFDFSTLWWMS